MKRESIGAILSAVFVDYDNIYLSLRRKSEEAAKRFAKDAGAWLNEIETGRLITPTNRAFADRRRRIVLNRCYGNPVPRRNQQDNSTDMNSFPFVRHHFLRAGFEIVDCPPLTAQLKNSSDIRIVMDVRDYLHHDTHFDEFVILSGDADFTPVLHRLRAHARRTVVFANDYTAAPYTAIADGELRETDLIAFILDGKLPGRSDAEVPAALTAGQQGEEIRKEIIAEIVDAVRAADAPVPLEVLAERAMRALGYDKTVGSSWAGAGNFRDLLAQSLPEDIRLTSQPPYQAFNVRRGIRVETTTAELRYDRNEQARPASPTLPLNGMAAPAAAAIPPVPMPAAQAAAMQAAPYGQGDGLAARVQTVPPPAAAQVSAPPARQPQLEAPLPLHARPLQHQQQQVRSAESATTLQHSIARIHDACQAPPLSPPEYRALFELMAQEINANRLQGAQTLANILARGQELGVDIRHDDVRFVLDVVSEADPWFEQGASANLFAARFRNFVVARCRSQGLNLSAEELDLIDAWFACTGAASAQPVAPRPAISAPQVNLHAEPAASQAHERPASPAVDQGGDRWWNPGEDRRAILEGRTGDQRPQLSHNMPPATPPGSFPAGTTDFAPADEFPRIIRTRLRG
jgi:NYN domain